MSTSKKNEPMCVVTIGYQSFLLPASVGMKVIPLFAQAVGVQRDLDDHEWVYQVGELPEVEYKAVRANQLRFPQPRKPLLLGGR